VANRSDATVRLMLTTEVGVVELLGEVTDIIAHAAFFQSLPALCPVDGSKTKFQYRKVGDEGFEYYELVSTGKILHKMPLRLFNDKTGRLYTKDDWYRFDTATGKDVLVWEKGRKVENHAQPEVPPTFNNPQEALAWAVNQKAYANLTDAKTGYEFLKKQLTTEGVKLTAALVYTKWIELVRKEMVDEE
jgi:hypothetical protein